MMDREPDSLFTDRSADREVPKSVLPEVETLPQSESLLERLCAPGAATLGLKESQYHQGWAVNCWGTGWRVGWGWGKPRKRGRYLVREASCRREQGQEAERG